MISKQPIKCSSDLEYEEKIEEIENIQINDITDEQNKKNYTKEEKHHTRKRKNR